MTATLFHYPMACSTACRIVAAEAGTPLSLKGVNVYTKELEGGGSYLDINPFGKVAALQFDNGSVLTETATIIAWIQSKGGNHDYVRGPEDSDYFGMLSWLNFCSTELHKGLLYLLMTPGMPKEAKALAKAGAADKLTYVAAALQARASLLPNGVSAADAYLLWALELMQFAGVELEEYPELKRFQAAMMARPAVAQVMLEDTKVTRRQKSQPEATAE